MQTLSVEKIVLSISQRSIYAASGQLHETASIAHPRKSMNVCFEVTLAGNT